MTLHVTFGSAKPWTFCGPGAYPNVPPGINVVCGREPRREEEYETIPNGYEAQTDISPGDYDLRVVLTDGEKFGRVTIPLKVDCGWEPVHIWIAPGYLTKSLMLTALPALALGAITVSGLARLGVNEVWSFFVSMPLFIVAWFCFVGWVIEWWLKKRRKTAVRP